MANDGAPVLLAGGFTHVGNVRTGNEDSHWVDSEAGIAIVCDGMGGHAAGEVASKLAVDHVRQRWNDVALARARDAWLSTGTPASRRTLIVALRDAVLEANQTIIEQSANDRDKHGMGTTFTGVMVIPGEALVAHAGDSRAYLVREGECTRLTEDHTLLARLAEAGVDTSDAARWKGVVTNALGIGEPTWISTAAVPLLDGDRLLLCSDGVSEYFEDRELGEVLAKVASPAKAAQMLVELAVARGGHDNATAVMLKVIEAGGREGAAATREDDDIALARCPLLVELSPQRRMRVRRLASEHTILDGEPVPARFLGDRVAWIVLEGLVVSGRDFKRAGGLVYPESLVAEDEVTTEWTARGSVRALCLRVDDVSELATEEPDLGEKLYAALAEHAGQRRLRMKHQTGETGEF
jgi:serine/threonine protein phosphatase PrpC